MFCFSCHLINAQVGIGTNSPNSQAVLEVSSTTKAFLLPRLSTAQRDQYITSPVSGMLIYNTTTGKFQGYAGTGSSGILANSTDGGTYTNLNDNDYPAQSFQVTQSTSYFSISVWVHQFVNGFTSGNVTFELYSGTPSGSNTLLNTQTTIISSLGKNTINISGVSLSINTNYFFIVKPTSSFGSSYPQLSRSGTGNGPYSSGSLHYRMGGNWGVSGDDLQFEVASLGATWVDLH